MYKGFAMEEFPFLSLVVAFIFMKTIKGLRHPIITSDYLYIISFIINIENLPPVTIEHGRFFNRINYAHLLSNSTNVHE